MTILVKIAGLDVTADVQSIDFWGKDTEGIGSFALKLLNSAAKYINTFAGDDTVQIDLDGVNIFNGYVDVITPKLSEELGAHTIESFVVTGRDVGQDLLNKLYDHLYWDDVAEDLARADDIIDDLLDKSNSEITFTSPHTAPRIYFDSRAQHLIDSTRQILELIDYSGLVLKNKAWTMFPHDGSVNHPDSGITLKSVAGASDNNIVRIVEHTEKDCTNIKNYIIVVGKEVNDGWTELNADDWTHLALNICTDYFPTGTPPDYNVMKGVAAIRCDKDAATHMELGLSFPLYNHAVLDFSKISNGELSLIYLLLPATLYSVGLEIELTDLSGDKIKWQVNKRAQTAIPQQLTLPIGKNVDIANGAIFDGWYYSSGTNFDWGLVRKINFIVDDFPLTSLIIDGLTLPVQMIAMAQDATSQGLYKVRKTTLTQTELTTQVELPAYADSILAKRKDPLDRLRLIAKGSAGLIGGVWKWLAGYQVTVNIPALGLNSVKYRFVSHHNWLSDDEDREHYVDLELVPTATKMDTQRWSYETQGQIGVDRHHRDRLKALEQKKMESRDWYPSLPRPLWELYGSIPPAGLDIQMYGVNRILNASFEFDSNVDGIPDKWEVAIILGSPTFGMGVGYIGANSAKIVCPTDSCDGEYKTTDCIPVTPSKDYFAALALKALNNNGYVYFGLRWFKADKTPSSTAATYLLSATPPTNWIVYSYTVTAPADAYYCKVVCVLASWMGTPGANTAYFDDIKFEERLLDAKQIIDNLFPASKMLNNTFINLTKFGAYFPFYNMLVPRSSLNFGEYTASLDSGYIWSVTSGAIALAKNQFYLDTSASSGSVTVVRDNSNTFLMTHSLWLKIYAAVTIPSTNIGFGKATIGDVAQTNELGFFFDSPDGANFRIRGYINNGVAHYTASSTTRTNGAYVVLEARDIGSGVEFFVDDVSIGTLTDVFAGGTMGGMSLLISNATHASNHIMIVRSFMVNEKLV